VNNSSRTSASNTTTKRPAEAQSGKAITPLRVLVIGGTLFIGRRLVAELVKDGHSVAVLHRQETHALGKKVESLVADRNDPEQVRRAVDGRRFEVVFDNVYDWERGTTATQVEATARACGDRLVRYIFMSSVAAYGDGLNHYEDDALAPDDHPNPYTRNKAMSERALFRMHQRSGFPAVTFRPPFIYGPENPFYREQFFWDRMRLNRPIIVPGDGGRVMQFVYVKDLVTAMMRAMADAASVGQSFNVGNERPVTQLEFVHALAKAANRNVRIARVMRERIIESGGNAMREPAYFGIYLDLPPITEAIGKLKRILKVPITPLEEGLAETYKWYAKSFRPLAIQEEFEDRLISMASSISE
jgi:2'-hydroxyisoflavone reductase